MLMHSLALCICYNTFLVACEAQLSTEFWLTGNITATFGYILSCSVLKRVFVAVILYEKIPVPSFLNLRCSDRDFSQSIWGKYDVFFSSRGAFIPSGV